MSVMRCKCRKQAETGLRCIRCEVPICPDCSRSAPVGFLCRGCADGRRSLHLYQIDARSLALGYLGTLAVALFGGWIMADYGMRIGFFGCFLAFFYGNVVGEAGLRITGRKRGLPMEIMVGVCIALGLVGGLSLVAMLHPHYFSEGGDVATATQSYLLSQLYRPLAYVVFGCALAGGISRIRTL